MTNFSIVSLLNASAEYLCSGVKLKPTWYSSDFFR